MSDENDDTTSTENTGEQSDTQEHNEDEQSTTVDPNIQTQEGAPDLTPAEQEAEHAGPNPAPVDAAPTTDLNASGSIASPAVENPANDPTTNDVEQTQEDRLADARSTAMTNHAAANGQSRADQSSRTEEEVS